MLVRHTYKHLAGCEISRLGGAYNRVLNCGSPRPNEEVFKVFEPKRVDSLLCTMIGFFNHDTQGTETVSNCPLCDILKRTIYELSEDTVS